MPSRKSKKLKKLPYPRKHFCIENLKQIFQLYPESDRKAPGVDNTTPKKFKDNLDRNIQLISEKLQNGTYKFSKLRTHRIPKANGKYRTICIPTVKDRFVQRLVLHELMHPNDKLNVKNEISFGSVEGTGRSAAIKRALNLRNKHPWVIKTDITSFFNSIDREKLINLLEKQLKKSHLMPLLKAVIECEVELKDAAHIQNLQEEEIIIGKGLRQGMPLSPYLSNIYLRKLDQLIIKKTLRAVRYVDDMIFFCDSEYECDQTLDLIRRKLDDLQLIIPDLDDKGKTNKRNPNSSVDFLGVEIYKKNEKFLCKVPEYVINHALQELDEYLDFQRVLDKNFSYFSLMNTIDNKIKGYKSAYVDAENTEHFQLMLRNKYSNIKMNLLETVLGKHCYNSLDKNRLKFLGID